MSIGKVTQLTTTTENARAKLDSMQTPRLVKPQPQPQLKKPPGPDRQFLENLVAGGEEVKINLLDGSVIAGVVEWADQYTLGIRGAMNTEFGDGAAEFFWTPKHSIQFIRKGGNANE